MQQAEPPSTPNDEQRDEIAKPELELTVEHLLEQCHQLLTELEEFERLYSTARTPSSSSSTNDIRPLRHAVSSDLKSLEKLAALPDTTPRRLHTLRSSNLPFLVAVWTTAKRQRGITAFQKRFYWEPASSPKIRKPSTKPNKRSALVDIVAEDGALWIKVSTVTPSRLLFELARSGWHRDDSSDSDHLDSDADPPSDGGEEGDEEKIKRRFDNAKDGRKVGALVDHSAGGESLQHLGLSDRSDSSDSEDEDKVEIVRIAEQIRRVAQSSRIRYAHPRVLFVLPRVREGEEPAIDGILAAVRATGAEICCGPLSASLAPSQPQPQSQPHPSVRPRFSSSLLPSAHPPLTSRLNLDCTVLLALISDLSHAHVPAAPEYHVSIRRQIANEHDSPLLPKVLYPALRGRDMYATAAAAERACDIVRTIGTPAEKRRACLLFSGWKRLGEERFGFLEGVNDMVAAAAEKGREALDEAWRTDSVHEWPGDFRLPVTVVDFDEEGDGDDSDGLEAAWRKLAPVRERVLGDYGLSPLNRSTLWHGWRKRMVTVSSNRTVVREVERCVSEWLNEKEKKEEDGGCRARGVEEESGGGGGLWPGPVFWLCGVARSLVGKETGRATGKKSSKKGDTIV